MSKFIPNFNIENIESEEENKKSTIIALIEETINISSIPFICSFIEFYLKNNYNIILIGERESLHFYSSVERKIGINILRKDNGFFFVDLNDLYTKLLSSDLPLEDNYPDSFDQVRKSEDEYLSFDKSFIDKNTFIINYQKIFYEIKKKIKTIKEKNKNKKTIIILDKVNDESIEALNDLLGYCYENEVNLMFSINKEINCEKNMEYLKYLSDILIKINMNESGFSKDINGLINIIIKMDLKEKNYFYRYYLKINEIKVFSHINI